MSPYLLVALGAVLGLVLAVLGVAWAAWIFAKGVKWH